MCELGETSSPSSLLYVHSAAENHSTRAFQQLRLKILVVIQCRIHCIIHMLLCLYMMYIRSTGVVHTQHHRVQCYLDWLSYWKELRESSMELIAGAFFLLLKQVLQCSELYTVLTRLLPGSKTASSEIHVLLSHAAVCHADIASFNFK